MNSLFNRVFLLAGMAAGTHIAAFAQCDDDAADELTVGTTCNPVAFNSTTNSDYWDDGWWNGYCNEDDLDDAWMWFDATSTMTTVTYSPTLGDAILTIFQGACSPYATSVACSDVAGSLGAETISFATVPGVRYHVRIQRYNSNANLTGTICVYSTGGGGGGPTTASDCAVATNICTNLSFSIDPNGYGAIDEIPDPGTYTNPDINPASGNSGCLLVGEYNSTWMVVNIATTGNLEFIFGGLGAQAGYFDWIMFPYNGASTCTAIVNGTIAPVRCNWNAVSYGGTGVSDVVPAGGDAGNFEPPLAVVAGQRYVICFSNYSNLATTVPLDFITGGGNADVSCIPLGFSMEGLAVECLTDARKLTWSAPVNNTADKFEIQRSRDNENWETVGTVYNGIVATNKMTYTMIDETNPELLDYYRLKQYSDNGDVMFSPVVSADCTQGEDLYSIYPNPSTGIMNLEYESASDTDLSFYDVYGNVVFRQQLERSMGPKTVQICASNVPAGMYLYRLVLDNVVKTGSVIIKN